MRNILVPLDGTEISEAALRWAAGAAYRSGSSLRLISVVSNAPDARMTLDSAAQYLAQKTRVLVGDGIKVDRDVIEGDASETILHEAKSADLTVLTSGTTRWFMSDVLDRVLQSMSSPVAIVRGDRGQLKGAINLDSILVPLSEANYSSAVLPATIDVATSLRAKVTLFRNVEVRGDGSGSNGLPPIVPRTLKAQLAEAEEYVDDSAEQLRKRGLDVQTMISCGDHVAEIVKASRTVGAGLIAMATRGRDRLENRISGSVANAVLESATVACLVIRAREPAQTSGLSPSRPMANAVSPVDNI